MNIELALMCGTDVPILELSLTLHQPTIKEISYIGEESFFSAVQCLEVNKNDILQDKTLLNDTTNFQIFMTIMQEKSQNQKKRDVLSLFQLILPKYKVLFSPNSIICTKGDITVIIDENNFEIFQNYLKRIFCFKETSKDSFNPANEQAAKIAQKLAESRKKIAKQNGDSEKNSIFCQYLSILTVGLNSMTLEDLTNLTMYQLFDLIERYSLYINWDLDIRSRLAGAKVEEKPEDWMKNIH